MPGTRRTTLIVCCCAALLMAPAAYAQHDHDHDHAHDKVAEKPQDPAAALSPKLRALLNEEMRLIDGGMGDLASAISIGDWSSVAKTAHKIEQSFIIKQKLTEKDAAELHDKLPAGFLEMDHAFHRTSGKLAHAATAHDAELVNFYVHRMLDLCVNCHAKYAPNRFPGLVAPAAEPHRH
ncbi:MAG: hypothetical protein GY716_13385 [bacterium]|nr:hypothetical protein [bacterium]